MMGLVLLTFLFAVQNGYPGGIIQYITNAKKLLKDSLEGANPFEGFVPSVPVGKILNTQEPEYAELEKAGIKATAFFSSTPLFPES